MDDAIKVVIKEGSQLNQQEIQEINNAKLREWKLPPMSDTQKDQSIFVLLKDQNDQVLAQGQLLPINGVIINNEMFNIIGIGGIIANAKGQGHGGQLMSGIKDYLSKQKKTAVGFTGNDVIGFYEKSGFIADHTSLKRFVHINGNKKVTNTTEDCVFYLDSEDKFMEKVLGNPSQEVFFPRDPDW